jgi:Protein of unknown function (DUF2786)
MTLSKDERDSIFHKVRSLLRRAEATDSEFEAEEAIKKAQMFIMRYAIDEEELWRNEPEQRATIETITIHIPDRKVGSMEKRFILDAVARANRCKMWYTRGTGVSTVAGHNSDLLFVEMLFTSILTQMNFKLAIQQAVNEDVNPRSFIASFHHGYADRISRRLADLSRENIAEVRNDSPGMELVLADRSAAVEKWVNSRIRIKTSTYSRSSSDETGYYSGRKAADETDLHTSKHIKGGRAKGELE